MGQQSRTPTEAARAYFEALDAGDVDTAVAQFTLDVEYRTPTHSNDVPLVEGREALREYFRDNRGDRESNHVVMHELDDGRTGCVHGYSEDTGMLFVSYIETDGDLIAYYAAGVLPNA